MHSLLTDDPCHVFCIENNENNVLLLVFLIVHKKPQRPLLQGSFFLQDSLLLACQPQGANITYHLLPLVTAVDFHHLLAYKKPGGFRLFLKVIFS